MPIDLQTARTNLDNEFAVVEEAVLGNQLLGLDDAALIRRFDKIFESATQAYREVLLGCILAKLQDPAIDVRRPYIGHGENAFNGRTLDERVVNPFLHDKHIPSSRGPYLSTFRRSVRFKPASRNGLRDKTGFDSLLAVINHVNEANEQQLTSLLRFTLYRFVLLRDAADVKIVRLQRISLEQYDVLIEGLLNTPSGGRFPVILIESALTAIRDRFGLNWTIEAQGINVADRPAGAGGDIMVRSGDLLLLAAEVTERPVERDRVVATFQAKIAPQGIEDYLFFVKNTVDEQVMRQARQYFAQGHEVNFLEMRNWLKTILSTIGRAGRDVFNRVVAEKLQAADIPAALKVAWNEQIERITAA
jgi:SacI restriction endonuclease